MRINSTSKRNSLLLFLLMIVTVFSSIAFAADHPSNYQNVNIIFTHPTLDSEAMEDVTTDCTLVVASWAKNTVTSGEKVNLGVSAAHCEGAQLHYEVMVDPKVANLGASIDPPSAFFNPESAASTWTSELLISSSTVVPTIFRAWLSSDPSTVIQSDVLNVMKAPARSDSSPKFMQTLPVGTTSTALKLRTNLNANCRYSTNPNSNFGQMLPFSSSGQRNHSTIVSGLKSGVNSYYVRCADSSGNINPDDHLIRFSVKKLQFSTQQITPPNLKVAFIGDTAFDSRFIKVLQLIKQENAQLVVHSGDHSYGNENAASARGWHDVVTSELGPSFPYISSVGNHDHSAWTTYQQLLTQRASLNPEVSCEGDYGIQSVCRFRGLTIVATAPDEFPGSYPSYIRNTLDADDSVWRICTWHKNMRAMQVGDKGDNTGWDVYEACRERGAIIATGHTHTYSRTKTLLDISTQLIDPTLDVRNMVKVGEGKTFVFDSSLGGASIRGQQNCLPASDYPYSACPWFAAIDTQTQTSRHGALFIEFNVDGNPNKARAYYMNVDNEILDQFDIISEIFVDSTPPTAPSNLLATALSDSQINLNWNAAVDLDSGISEYIIYEDSIKIGTTSELSFLSAGLSESTLYSYQVSAVNLGGIEGPKSSATTISTPADTSGPVLIGASSFGTANSIDVKFNEVLDPVSSIVSSNYIVSPEISVVNVLLNSDQKSVKLTTSQLSSTIPYTLTVSNVKDRANSPNSILPNSQISFDFINIDPTLKGWYMFESDELITAVDSSLDGLNDGSLVGTQRSADSAVGDKSIEFNSRVSHVEVSTSNWNVNQGSVALWLKFNSILPINYIFGHTTQSGGFANRIQLYSRDNSFGVGMGDRNGAATNIFSFNPGIWYHVALTWNSGNFKAYVDGMQVSTGSYTGLSTLNPFADLGNNGKLDNRQEAMDGLIDDARIYDRSLSSNEVLALAVGTTLPPECNLGSASWSTTSTVEETMVSLDVSGTNCIGESLGFVIHEDDATAGGEDSSDDTVSSNPSNAAFSSNTATATWSAQFQSDGSTDPEYYFIASLISDPSNSIRSTDLLSVAQSVNDNNPPITTPVLAPGEIILSISTNEAANCRYGLTGGIGYNDMFSFDETGTLSHSTSVGELGSASHNYFIKCRDGTGNINMDDFEISFVIQ